MIISFQEFNPSSILFPLNGDVDFGTLDFDQFGGEISAVCIGKGTAIYNKQMFQYLWEYLSYNIMISYDIMIYPSLIMNIRNINGNIYHDLRFILTHLAPDNVPIVDEFSNSKENAGHFFSCW